MASLRYSTDSASSTLERQEDSLMGYGFKSHSIDRIRRQRKTTLILLCLVLCEPIILIVLTIYCLPHTRVSPQLLGELNGIVPDFPLRTVLFTQDPLATIHHPPEFGTANATREDWLSYMPSGNGFIAVDSNSDYKLPPAIHYKEENTYSVAMFHQLHCLYTIMSRYNELTEGSTHSRATPKNDLHPNHNHVDHCFRYLRQSILCCGDVALEGQDPNSRDPATDGSGAIHVCKNFDDIRNWAEERRLTTSKHL